MALRHAFFQFTLPYLVLAYHQYWRYRCYHIKNLHKEVEFGHFRGPGLTLIMHLYKKRTRILQSTSGVECEKNLSPFNAEILKFLRYFVLNFFDYTKLLSVYAILPVCF